MLKVCVLSAGTLAKVDKKRFRPTAACATSAFFPSNSDDLYQTSVDFKVQIELKGIWYVHIIKL